MANASPPKVAQGVFCPMCRKKIAEELDGRLVMTCRHCKERVEIVHRAR